MLQTLTPPGPPGPPALTPQPVDTTEISTEAIERIAADDPLNFEAAIQAMTSEMITDISEPLAGAGFAIWAGLAGVMLSWHGIKMALSPGQASAGSIVQLIITLLIPWALLEWASEPVYGDVTLVGAVTSLGTWTGSLILADGVDLAIQELLAIWNSWADLLAGRLYPPAPESNWATAWGHGLLNLFTTAVNLLKAAPGLILMLAMAILMLVMVALCFGQLLFAGFAISMTTALAPLFIPWLAFNPMSFLFWGWLRCLLTLSLWAPIAAAVLRVFGLTGLQYASFWLTPDPSILPSSLADGAALGAAALFVIPGALPAALGIQLVTAALLGFVGILAALKIPAMAQGLVSGSANFDGAGAVLAATAAIAGTAVAGASRLGSAAASLRSAGRAA